MCLHGSARRLWGKNWKKLLLVSFCSWQMCWREQEILMWGLDGMLRLKDALLVETYQHAFSTRCTQRNLTNSIPAMSQEPAKQPGRPQSLQYVCNIEQALTKPNKRRKKEGIRHRDQRRVDSVAHWSIATIHPVHWWLDWVRTRIMLKISRHTSWKWLCSLIGTTNVMSLCWRLCPTLGNTL